MSGKWRYLLFTPDRATLVMSFRYLTDDHFGLRCFMRLGILSCMKLSEFA